MKRALRVDKIRLAALEATLQLYRDPDRLAERLPTLRAAGPARGRDRGPSPSALAPALAAALGPGFAVEVAPCASQIGSGALPLDTLPSARPRVRARRRAGRRPLDALAARLPAPCPCP